MRHISKPMAYTLAEISRASLSYWIGRAITCSELMDGESKQFLFNQMTCEFEAICESILSRNILAPIEVDDHRRRFYDTQLKQSA